MLSERLGDDGIYEGKKRASHPNGGLGLGL